MKRVLIVARVSRDEGQDPHTQTAALRATGGRHGWEIVHEIEVTTSAWDERESAAFRKMVVAAVDRHRPDIVAVWATDRLCREGIETTLGLLRTLEEHYRCEYYSLTEPMLSTATADPMIRPLLRSLLAWVAQQESQRRSDRVKAKIASKKAHAKAGGGRAVWGMGRLPNDEDVASAKALQAEGLTTRQIAARIGLGKSTVARLLQKPAPTGRPGQVAQAEGPNTAKEGQGLGQTSVSEK